VKPLPPGRRIDLPMETFASPPSAVPVPARASWVKWALVILPAGTVVLGVVAMIWYFQRDRWVGAEQVRGGFFRKDATAASLADYVEKLSGPVLGTRGAGGAEGRRGLQAAASLVEGSLGETNMGYRVQAEDFTAGGVVHRNLWVDNPAERNPTELVEVRVSLDREGPGPAGLEENLPLGLALELAHSLAGTSQRRAIRFLFLGNNSAVGASPPRGTEVYRPRMDQRAFKVMGVFDLDTYDGRRHVGVDGAVDFAGVLADLEELRAGIVRSANQ
jgi:hypothetical protein